jgi:hypothetical protein
VPKVPKVHVCTRARRSGTLVIGCLDSPFQPVPNSGLLLITFGSRIRALACFIWSWVNPLAIPAAMTLLAGAARSFDTR